ncbi:MAG: hypothetical protein Q8P18_09685 [Pseudomonadota bacterium]|nr:hypothetical protein [Pseudomonadota bacterium]
MTDAEVARLYDFSTPVKLPGQRAWTARFRAREPGRAGLVSFVVVVRDRAGVATTFEETVALPEGGEAPDVARGRWLLDLEVRRRLGIASHARPLCP